MENLLRELGVQSHLKMHKRKDSKVGEKKRKPRQMPSLGVIVTETGRSFAEILRQPPTLEGEAEVEFKENDCANSLDQMD